MPTEASIVELGQVAQVRSGYAFKSSEWSSSGIPVVKIANVKSGRLEMAGCSFIPSDIAKEAGDFNLSAGDILIAMTGYIGDVARVLDTDLPVVLNQRVGKFILKDKTRLNDDYLFQFLRWSETRRAIEALGYGSAQPNVSPSLIHGIEIPLPAIEEQREIASILGALDDKIELNRRMNGTLEALAQAVFKEWFVEKAEKRWETMKVEDALTITKGVSYKSAELADSEVALVTLKSINRGGGYRTDGLKPYVGKYKPAQVITPGELVVAQTDVTQGAEVIGKPALVLIDERQKTLVASLDLLILRPKLAHLDQHFFYLLFRTEDFQNHIYGYTSGTTVLHLSKQGLPSYEFKAPPPALGKRFAEYVKPLFDRIASNAAETRTLTALRDTLLPKLMRGEVRVGLNYTS